MGYDTTEIYQSTSEYLKADDIGTNFWQVTISNIGIKDFEDGSRKLLVSFTELDKSLVVNKTNSDSITGLYGTNTDGWIGRQIMLFSMPVKFQDKMVNSIRVRAPAQQQAMPTHPAPRQPGQMQPSQPAPKLQPGQFKQPVYNEQNPPPISPDDVPF